MYTSFPGIAQLPPYIFNIIAQMRDEARRRGEDIIDLSMGNPDKATPSHILDKLVEVAHDPKTHRYSQSKGIPRLRQAISSWYKRRFDVYIDPETEAIATIGSKEGLAHLALALVTRGDAVLVPSPAYPIHTYGFVIVGADIRHVPLTDELDFFEELKKAIVDSWPRPKLLVLNFPSNPTTACVDLDFFEKVVAIAREYEIWIVHDIAYADIVFDGYVAPSILQVPGAKEVAVEFFSLSKSYNMAGWRVGFCCGNSEVINALARVKSYFDYGSFTPIQVAAITALNSDQACVKEIAATYQKRRDTLCNGLNNLGWQVDKPRATMFVWAKIPESYIEIGSVEFCKKLISIAKIAASPGVGFGRYGEGYVRFALVEDEHRIRQAVRGIRAMFRSDGKLEV
jgi:alanine-synthesizing transaminase